MSALVRGLVDEPPRPFVPGWIAPLQVEGEGDAARHDGEVDRA